jgi:ADP-ribose pyrophosphatase
MSNRGGVMPSTSVRRLESSPVVLSVNRPTVMIVISVLLMILIPSIIMLGPWKSELNQIELRNKLRDVNGGQPHLRDSGPYSGSPLWKTDQTLGRLVLGETPFARCDVHSVLVESATPGSPKIIHDWIFLEERDAVNVAVVTRDKDEPKFLMFQQQKYAIPGDTLAPVGGFINDGETPFHAAQREVWEELGVGSPRTKSSLPNHNSSPETHPLGDSPKSSIVPRDNYGLAWGNITDDEADSWVFLGKYRTMANRGGGFIYTYLLMDAIPLFDGGGTSAYQKNGDSESQTLLKMTFQEVKDAVLQGRFQEVKWTATISLALLHMDKIRQ